MGGGRYQNSWFGKSVTNTLNTLWTYCFQKKFTSKYAWNELFLNHRRKKLQLDYPQPVVVWTRPYTLVLYTKVLMSLMNESFCNFTTVKGPPKNYPLGLQIFIRLWPYRFDVILGRLQNQGYFRRLYCGTILMGAANVSAGQLNAIYWAPRQLVPQTIGPRDICALG